MASWTGISLSVRKVQCPHCKKRLKTELGLLNHQYDKHPGTCPEGPFDCSICGKTFKYLFSVKQHEENKVHGASPSGRGKQKTEKRDTPCPLCDKYFVGRKGLEQHTKVKHPYRPRDLSFARQAIAKESISRNIGHSHVVPKPATDSSQDTDFLQKSPYELNNFVETELQPDADFNTPAHDKVRQLVNFHQHNVGYSVKEIILSGSFGKGTQVKGFSDLDCVLELNDIKSLEERKRAGRVIFMKLEDLFKSSTFATLTNIKKTRFAVQFDMESCGEKTGVDILPTFDTSKLTKGTKESMYREILQSPPGDQEFYSVALCQYQLDFVRKQPAKLKNLIRLVKFWNKTVVKPQAKTVFRMGRKKQLRYPNSYPLELITIHVCEKIGNKESFDMASAFKAVMQQLVDYENIDAEWYDNYTQELAAMGKKGMKSPILLDPANPSNNVLSASEKDALEHVAEIAADTMKKPLLRNVIIPAQYYI